MKITIANYFILPRAHFVYKWKLIYELIYTFKMKLLRILTLKDYKYPK